MNYCADDLVLMSETMEDLRKRFWNWKGARKSKGQHQKTRDVKRVGRTVQKLDRSMWSLWEESLPILCCAQNVKTGFMADVHE